jgi:L-glyceraldehyde 3-phosphate reductase
MLSNIAKLNEIADARRQTLAQMAIAWVLRNGGIKTALIGASKPEQIIDCDGAVNKLEFTNEELAAIDQYADEEAINLWLLSSETPEGGAVRWLGFLVQKQPIGLRTVLYQSQKLLTDMYPISHTD